MSRHGPASRTSSNAPGRIDVLVNNAGVGLLGAAEEIPVDQARALYETNLFGTARMVNAVLPVMRQRRDGLIINLGSVAGGLPIPFDGYLSSSKAAIATYSDALRLELKPLHIAVTVVEPGAVATRQGEGFTALKAGASIGDYAGQEQKALAVFEAGQRSGSAPELVARTIQRIIGTPTLARYYLVGPEKWYARLARILPPAALEAAISRRFRLPAWGNPVQVASIPRRHGASRYGPCLISLIGGRAADCMSARSDLAGMRLE